MRQQLLQDAVELVKNRQYQNAVEELKEILEPNEQDDVHYKALKIYGDILGPLAYKDYMGAIDVYQTIINESEDDDLYQQCQVSILNAYLSVSTEMMDAFESMRDMLETEDDQMLDALHQLDERREDFLTTRAELIYKKRL
jgi:hypothetical protein